MSYGAISIITIIIIIIMIIIMIIKIITIITTTSIRRVLACYKATGDALLRGETLCTSIINLLRIFRPPH